MSQYIKQTIEGTPQMTPVGNPTPIDTVPTENSTHLVTSGGIYDAIEEINSNRIIAEVNGDGVKTYGTLLNELYNSANISAYDDSYYILYYDNNIKYYYRCTTDRPNFNSIWCDDLGNIASQNIFLSASSSVYRSWIYASTGQVYYENGEDIVSSNSAHFTLYKRN